MTYYLSKEIVTTEDGSPSLVFHTSEDKQMMHSFKGAYSETEYIYGAAIDKIIHLQKPKIISIGLGFGYCELTVLVRLMQHSHYQIITYESEADLKQALISYLQGEETEYTKQYVQIFSRYEEAYSLSTGSLKKVLLHAYESEKWLLRESFDFQQTDELYNAILFDPFCSRFHAAVWEEKSLHTWLQHMAADSCVFSTYAAKGDLKRSLKELGFTLEKRPGFGLKRESTLAYRGIGPS